jgi:thioredoxin-like negative regulator of GroEL
VEKLAEENKDKLKLVNIEAYDNKQLTKALAVDALPTLILYKGKEAVWKKHGLSSEEEILTELNKHKI